jgi:CheY-like chemotaxis protein
MANIPHGSHFGVDDEELVRASIAAVLRRSGHAVTLAEDGEEALCKFAAESYDLVITDIVMPRMEGIETVRALRRLDPGVCIIAISGSSGDQGFYLKAAAALGADATLQKPFRAAELQQLVDALLAGPAASSEILWYRQDDRREAAAISAERNASLARKRDLPKTEFRFHSSKEQQLQPKRVKL